MANRIRLAVDAMSGDQGAEVCVAATLAAVNENPSISALLVGRTSVLEPLLGTPHPRIRIVDAPEVVTMDEPPARALRQKKASSMAVALQLVRSGEADACVSAGNTGALMMMGRSILKMYPGIERPAIVKLIPSLHNRCYVLDLGANVDTSAEHLFQFALMGSLMVAAIDGKAAPRVALLNVGEEEVKGSEQVRLAAHSLAACEALNYIGYVEGNDLFQDVADVVVCDGFVGNIALKTGEGVALMVMEVIEQAFQRTAMSRVLGVIARPFLNRLLRQIDPRRHNGASLLGLQGVVVKSHGNADARAFRAALRQAAAEVRMRVPQKINARLDELAF
ncbi:MAG: phosphate acyltransferase [Alteromonadaceae bacterium]|uniref:Phosphate acyltransferase n=1 Tax=Hydrocarboniclastica marina TaxID=2259620 RepID=A0A4P7XL95_9ALTE|nr:phosphate acyltransferase [Alteromonadaceae bacterium]QCF27858.1 phosphate acyltransferase PlsX [Hydrocarboniclastica marina]